VNVDFNQIIEYIIDYCRDNLTPVLAAAALFILFFYRKPKLFFTVLCIAVLLGGVIFFISHLADLGSTQKEKLSDPFVLEEQIR
jgi:hypothetical protein